MLTRKFVAGFISAVSLTLMLAAGGASAEPGASPWDKFDADKDGLISKEEAAGMRGLAQLFDKIDANHDGKLDKTELSAIHGGGHGHGHGGKGHDDAHPHGGMDKGHDGGHLQGT
ncbi:MAG: hypothetical protein AB1469_06450 [Pseudomonadota bacterium]